ncbi:DedA family protein [Ruegeria arenilitoris]|uniref:DedA family protein n=1 Tax=Ruegeria arenilitoris TaxID=1173585 RepID=UPI00148024C0|nr:DedA family protein [Ruegeria arenilitoris]
MSHVHEYFSIFSQDFALPTLFLALFLETLGLPIPGETVLISSAAIASQGDLNIFLVVIVSVAASMAGDNVAYFIGRRFGRKVILTYGTKIGITQERYEKAEQATERFGAYVVVVARFFILLRQLNGLVAGATGMPWQTFVLANAIGSLLWVSFWTTLAYKLGQNVSLLPWVTHHLAMVASIAVVMTLLLMAVLFVRARHVGRDKSV